MQIDFIFSIAILIFSVVIHEVSHGYFAYLQGDNTAFYQGRLSLNPLKHLEWFGSFILPVISYFTGGFIIGWAKPVPFNPYNLRNQRWGEAIVAIAGPLANIFVAFVFSMFIRFNLWIYFGPSFLYILSSIIFINLVLATFNLVPIAPLDGSKILFSILPYSMNGVRSFIEKYSLILILIFVFYLWQFIVPVVIWEFSFLTGITLP